MSSKGKVMSTQDPKKASNKSRRWRWLGAVLGVALLGTSVYGTYWAQVLRYHQRTDDAYVGGNVVQITPQISGTVVAIGADDTQFVKAGQPLVRLDPADARVALDQAEAQFAMCVISTPRAHSSRPRCRCARPSLPPRRAISPGASASASRVPSRVRSCNTLPMQ